MNDTASLRQKTPATSIPPATAKEWLSPKGALISAVAWAALVFAIYSPALHFQFILDDHRFTADPRLQSSGHVWEYFTTFVWAQVQGGPLSFYRPLFVSWVRLNFILCEASPWGWHLLSIAKHVSVAFLLGLLAWKLLRDRVAALVAPVLFALHPAQTESVAWVTVPDPLMSAAVLGAVLLYFQYTESVAARSQLPDPRSGGKAKKNSRKQGPVKPKDDFSALWLIASTIACLAALMAKETAIVLPAVFFALALITPQNKSASEDAPGQPSASFASRLILAFRQTLPFLAVTVIYLLMRLKALGDRLASLTQNLPWKTVLLSWPATLWFYVKVLFWPVRSRAFADPDLPDSLSFRGVILPGLGVVLTLAILACACIWAWKIAQRDLPQREALGVVRAVLLGALLLVLPILPALNLNALNPDDFLHGRYTYLPLAGLMLLFAVGWRLAKKIRPALLLAFAVIAVVFSVLTIQQESPWKDDLTLFTSAHELAPHNIPVDQSLVRAHVQVALGLDEQDRCDEAVPMFNEAISKYPNDWYAWAGLGECFFKLNDLSKAEQSLRRASELSHEPRVTEQWHQLREHMGLPPMPMQ